ncbi:hypothetical protein B1757_02380 [Acidithiobacillus marinus]|uniref:Uncharacterized protein n=1 Tax=Acidithiobacillus marinus TaxID=187490 RepID=A0A2I1DPL8_9PROT|nr:hypothetical protein [Acidithiobacillus marinus]PKY11828.1 hypothetical protein B1757_02380 [Acidithiobacillus marinus]
MFEKLKSKSKEAPGSGDAVSDMSQKDAEPKKPINGIMGGNTKVKANKKKLVWGSLAVLVVAILIANKVVVGHHESNAGNAQTEKAAALPSMSAGVVAHPAKHTNSTIPAMPANGGLVAVKPEKMNPVTSPAPVSVQAVQSILSDASNNTVTVVQVWPGPGHLDGVIYKDVNNNEGVAWVNLHRGLVLIGTLIGRDGKNYNNAAQFSMAADQEPTPETAATISNKSSNETSSDSTDTLIALKTRGDGFVVGSTGPEITVYIDPNSEASHRLYDALQSAVDAGKVRARYVLVALKNKSSLTKAEQILSAPSPAKVLSTDERLGKKNARNTWSGGIRGVQGSLSMTQIVNMNTALLASAGYIGDPVVIWCDKAGKAQVATNDGAIGDLSAILSAAGTCH